jgi:hypothetical protein
MKWTYFLIILIFSSPLWSRDREILKCLGEEEKRFHLKKETGPVYDLNQRLIAEMIQVPKVELVKEHFLTICSGEKFSESWKLLELSIKFGKAIFIIPSNVTGIQRSMTEGMIEDYVESTREILLNFIAQIQSISPSPSCLKEEVPELDQFFTEIKYLQEDVETKKIFEGKDQTIFEKLKNYPSAFERCAARLKKKLKSGSKAAPKKR